MTDFLGQVQMQFTLRINCEIKGFILLRLPNPEMPRPQVETFNKTFKLFFSQYDNQLRREKCMAGVKEALLKGEWCHKAPYGYDEIKRKWQAQNRYKRKR